MSSKSHVDDKGKVICAQIGIGGLDASTPLIGTNQLLHNKASSLFEKCRVQMEERNLPDIGTSCIGRADGSKESTLQTDVGPVGKRVVAIVGFKPCYFENAMNTSLSSTDTETALYFYHSDHSCQPRAERVYSLCRGAAESVEQSENHSCQPRAERVYSLCRGAAESVEQSENHLGSASWITDASGTPVQHLQYCPILRFAIECPPDILHLL